MLSAAHSATSSQIYKPPVTVCIPTFGEVGTAEFDKNIKDPTKSRIGLHRTEQDIVLGSLFFARFCR
jgi:hypothetical protein